jgi:hypothetical protein
VDQIDGFGKVTTWYPPLDWINYVDSRLFTDEYTFMKKYTTLFYYSMLCLGGNEIGPVNTNELFAIVSALLTCLFVNAFLLSDVSVLIGNLGKSDSAYQEKLDSINELMTNLEIEEDLA